MKKKNETNFETDGREINFAIVFAAVAREMWVPFRRFRDRKCADNGARNAGASPSIRGRKCADNDNGR